MTPLPHNPLDRLRAGRAVASYRQGCSSISQAGLGLSLIGWAMTVISGAGTVIGCAEPVTRWLGWDSH